MQDASTLDARQVEVVPNVLGYRYSGDEVDDLFDLMPSFGIGVALNSRLLD